MTKRISSLYGMDVFSLKGEYVGKVQDVILNLEKGSIMSMCLKPFRESSTDSAEVKRILKEESISYDNVSTVGEVVLVKTKPAREPIRKKLRRASDDELDSVSMG
jgi:sporulation protein YlmC with PRC-barrel domain